MTAPSQERCSVGLAEQKKIVVVAQALELDVLLWSEAPRVPVQELVVADELWRAAG
jgi:hypothetical protein